MPDLKPLIDALSLLRDDIAGRQADAPDIGDRRWYYENDGEDDRGNPTYQVVDVDTDRIVASGLPAKDAAVIAYAPNMRLQLLAVWEQLRAVNGGIVPPKLDALVKLVRVET